MEALRQGRTGRTLFPHQGFTFANANRYLGAQHWHDRLSACTTAKFGYSLSRHRHGHGRHTYHLDDGQEIHRALDLLDCAGLCQYRHLFVQRTLRDCFPLFLLRHHGHLRIQQLEKNTESGIVRIAITGPESTGKSALAKELANIFQAHWIPEYARTYLMQKGTSYDFDDVTRIALEQQKLEQEAAKHAALIFCDTDALVCKIWQEYVFEKTAPEVDAWFDVYPYSFTLLCDIDLPWEPDPLREHPDKREELFLRYQDALIKKEIPYGIVKGQGAERLARALQIFKSSGINAPEI